MKISVTGFITKTIIALRYPKILQNTASSDYESIKDKVAKDNGIAKSMAIRKITRQRALIVDL